MKSLVRRWLNGLTAYRSVFSRKYPPGHFYSPVPNLDCALKYRRDLDAQAPDAIGGVDLNTDSQLSVLVELARWCREFDFPEVAGVTSSQRYWRNNGFFPGGDGVVLFGLLRMLKSKAVIEVGSGFSSALMLDMRDAGLIPGASLSFIDPDCARLRSLLRDRDGESVSILEKRVQDVRDAEMPALSAGDIFFIDSSHVASVGSDLCHIVFEMLPKVPVGCLVHVHDVAWPFEYPAEWFKEGRAWNEAYLLRAFLQYNDSFEVYFWGSMLKSLYPNEVEAALPLLGKSAGSSIWLRRVK
ncbi:MAG: class I SAM-dependent methyltransferase [Planctomycetota bacterium]